MATIVADAVEELAGIVKLSAYSSFSLFECRKAVVSKSPDSGNEEYVGLDDNKYIGDLLADFKASKDRSKGEILHCKIVLKKKLFRESDEAITNPMFVQLSFVQKIYSRKNPYSPVSRRDAVVSPPPLLCEPSATAAVSHPRQACEPSATARNRDRHRAPTRPPP